MAVVRRRPGRPAWLPAILTWIPLVVAGAWLTTGFQIEATALRNGQYSTRVVLLAPTEWLGDVMGWVGLMVFVAGLTMLSLYVWSPDPLRWRFVVTEFPAFRMASWILVALAFYSFVDLGTAVRDVTPARQEWRFISGWRTDVWNQLLGWTFLTLGIACNIAAYGAAWRVMPWPLPPQVDADQDHDHGQGQ